MMGYGYGGGFGWGMGGGGIFSLILWGGLIVFAVWAVRALLEQRNTHAPPSPSSPHEALRRRYAAGEINREEFERMKHDLNA
ncbi:MAG TPA: SHOCT domain-containing protein [Desulfuromonadales bacterium]|nr:SHOCT domain-containing protein [Desulfuromonadales bacterium]